MSYGRYPRVHTKHLVVATHRTMPTSRWNRYGKSRFRQVAATKLFDVEVPTFLLI